MRHSFIPLGPCYYITNVTQVLPQVYLQRVVNQLEGQVEKQGLGLVVILDHFDRLVSEKILKRNKYQQNH